MLKFIFCLTVTLTTTMALHEPANAASDDFFSGKTLRIVVGFPPGGGFDTYARTIARHMGRQIRGNLDRVD